jgi:hypothetical protein
VNVGYLPAGVGGGVNVLVGGFKKSIDLEPISVEGEKRLNFAAGDHGAEARTNGCQTEHALSERERPRGGASSTAGVAFT